MGLATPGSPIVLPLWSPGLCALCCRAALRDLYTNGTACRPVQAGALPPFIPRQYICAAQLLMPMLHALALQEDKAPKIALLQEIYQFFPPNSIGM